MDKGTAKNDDHIWNGGLRSAERVSLPEPHDLSPAQKRVYEDVVNGPRGTIVGPLRAVIHSPELADRWQRFGEFVRYRTIVPHLHKELAILLCARRWNSELEWAIHGRVAMDAGLDMSVLDDIRDGNVPHLDDPAAADVYDFTRELQIHGNVSERTYRAVKKRWGEQGVVELTAVIGYYTMVAMMLNTHQVPLPAGEAMPKFAGPVKWNGLTDIPARNEGSAMSEQDVTP